MELPQCINQDTLLVDIISVINHEGSDFYWENGQKVFMDRNYYAKESKKIQYSLIKRDILCKDYYYFLVYEKLGLEIGKPLYSPRSGVIKITDCKVDTIVEIEWTSEKRSAKSPQKFNETIGNAYLEYIQSVLMKKSICNTDNKDSLITK